MSEMGKVIQFPGATEPWVDARAAANHFGVTVSTIHVWVSEGMPTLSKERRHRRFRLSECERWHRGDVA